MLYFSIGTVIGFMFTLLVILSRVLRPLSTSLRQIYQSTLHFSILGDAFDDIQQSDDFASFAGNLLIIIILSIILILLGMLIGMLIGIPFILFTIITMVIYKIVKRKK